MTRSIGCYLFSRKKSSCFLALFFTHLLSQSHALTPSLNLPLFKLLLAILLPCSSYTCIHQKIDTNIIRHTIHQKTQHDSRFYELKISIPESYPATPPKVRFVSKINMNCVDPNNGEIIYSKVPATKNWNRNMGMEQVLISLRAEMASGENRRTKQPPEGSTF